MPSPPPSRRLGRRTRLSTTSSNGCAQTLFGARGLIRTRIATTLARAPVQTIPLVTLAGLLRASLDETKVALEGLDPTAVERDEDFVYARLARGAAAELPDK